MIGIYKFTNKVTNKSYIGQSIDIEKRYKAHLNNAFNKKYVNYYCDFYKALREYGIENFVFEILKECDREDLNEEEKYYVKKFNSYNNGYNMTPGGDFNPSNVPEIVEKRTFKLLNDKEINDKLSHKGEENPNSKLTKEDVIKIRQSYAKGEKFGDVYQLFSNKISYSGFQYCWLGKTWKTVMPEVFEKRHIENTGGSTNTCETIANIRIDFMNGMTNKELQIKYNMNYANVRKILKLERWKQEASIPKGYENFILK